MSIQHNIPSLRDYPAFVSARSDIVAGNTTLPRLFEWHATQNPDYPLFLFHEGNGVRALTYRQAIMGIRRAAHAVRIIAGGRDSQVIGILASCETITYALTILGILRAGHIVFPISPRNGPAAVAHLLQSTSCTSLIVSDDDYTSAVARDAISLLEEVSLHPIFKLGDLLSPTAHDEDVLAALQLPDVNHDDTAVILHSSGSTNHPKPINWTHKGLISWSTVVWHGEANLAGAIIGIQAIPMFHAFGTSALLVAASTGWILSVFPPSSPPIFPMPESVFDGAFRTRAHYMMTIPLFIEQWAQDPEKVKYMSEMRGLVFGGAPLNKEVGDTLASAGVSLLTAYGCTELGTISNVIPVSPGLDWEYFSITKWLPHVIVDAGDGYSEVVATAAPNHPLAVVNTKVNGVDAYATGDLLEPHPTNPGLWKVFGRRDDQIILSNGEKTNPIPLEHIINEDPHVHACLIFGQSRSQNGVLIDPKPEFAFDSEDDKALENFRNLVWASVERANAFAPQHSRIFKEMIIVSSPSKPFTYNAKGYPRRLAIIKEYQDEIAQLYSIVEQSSQGGVAPPSRWDEGGVLGFVQELVYSVLHQRPADDTDIFRSGCDSLQATWIRNSILRVVRDHSPAAAKRLPMNVVFQYPSIRALSDTVLRSVTDPYGPSAPAAAASAEDLMGLAERYAADLPRRPSQLRARDGGGDVVLITGTTGGFGCDVLERLLRDETVARVYAFNRRGSDAPERQRARFRERGHDEALLAGSKFRMVEADLDASHFGIDIGLHDEIVGSVTCIIHNAWQVNFNLTLSSFEPDLRRLRNLIGLALQSPASVPPKVMFVSSIGVVGRYSASSCVPESLVEPSAALGSGYSQSKWVAERMLAIVSARAVVPTVAVRLGQVCGDRLGHWNEREWFPSMVKSAKFTQSLPDMNDAPSFIPSYPAASALVELRNTASPTVHLVHPRPVEWRALVSPIAEEFGVPLVRYADWLRALERCAAEGAADEVGAMRENPALRLLDFFRASRDRGAERLQLSTEKAEEASQTLRGLPALGPRDSQRWMGAWRASGFL